MKKVLFFLLLTSYFFFSNLASAQWQSDRSNISMKAGPTNPREALSIAWVEAMVYPKNISPGQMLSLGVRTASPVVQVLASFDFSREKVELDSTDGLSWNASFKLPNDVRAGVHVVRYRIAAKRGEIQRTVQFFVSDKSTGQLGDKNFEQGETVKTTGWPLTVKVTGEAVAGGTLRSIKPGEIVIGLSKMPWYKVIFSDGKEGWIQATNLKEPTEDYFVNGRNAYLAKDYNKAISFFLDSLTVDPSFVKGQIWLSKSYLAKKELEPAATAIKKALQLDERDLDARVTANVLAQEYFSLGNKKFSQGRYHEAVSAFREVVALKNNSVSAWVKLGESFDRLKMKNEARESWREGLRYDPENRQLLALLKQEDPVRPARERMAEEPVPELLVDDSLKIVKNEKTIKGTKIEAALQSVVSLTKSLGTPIVERGWQAKKRGNRLVVSYVCEQSSGGLETFDWLVDVDTKQVTPGNENARLLMSRW